MSTQDWNDTVAPLLARHAPVFMHKLWWLGDQGRYDKRDFLSPVNFRGWDKVYDNYKFVADAEDREFVPEVYCWGAATKEHYYLGYSLYHPYDWCSDFWRVIEKFKVADEHPHDMEGLVLMVPRDPGHANAGKVIAAFVVYHWDVIPFVWDEKIQIAPKTVTRAEKTLRPGNPVPQPLVYIAPGSHSLDCWHVENTVQKWEQQERQGKVVEGMVYQAPDAQTAAHPVSGDHSKFQRVGLKFTSIAGPDSLLRRKTDGQVFMPQEIVHQMGGPRNNPHEVKETLYTFAHRDGRTNAIVAGKAVPPWYYKSCNDPYEIRGLLFNHPAAYAGRYLRGRSATTGRRVKLPGTGDRAKYEWNTVEDGYWV